MKNKQLLIAAIGVLILIAITNLFALTITTVTMDPNTISPGESADISLLVKNNGNNDLTDITVNLDFTNLPLAPFDTGSSAMFDELNNGKSKEANFKLVALNDAKSGIYKIPVQFNYNEDGVTKNGNSVISVIINSEPIIDLTYDTGLFLKGQQNKITVKVINKGLADVMFLEADLDGSTYYNVLSPKNAYIGDINSNDYQTFDYNIFFKENSPSITNLPITLTYKDTANKEYTKDFTLPIQTYTQAEAINLGLIQKSNTSLIIIAIVLIVVIFFIYRFFRRRKKNNSV